VKTSSMSYIFGQLGGEKKLGTSVHCSQECERGTTRSFRTERPPSKKEGAKSQFSIVKKKASALLRSRVECVTCGRPGCSGRMSKYYFQGRGVTHYPGTISGGLRL